jgi:hypothetical protein
MHLEADGTLATLNELINSNALLSALLVTLFAAVVGWGITALRRRHQRSLTYIDDTERTIGYAEAEALPFFPSAAAIPISVNGVGYEPTRRNTRNGDYSFYATEYLYTNGIPSGLEADVIDFLTSRAVAASYAIPRSSAARTSADPSCPARARQASVPNEPVHSRGQ